MRMKEQYRRKPNQEVSVVGLATSGGQSGLAGPSNFRFAMVALPSFGMGCAASTCWSHGRIFAVAMKSLEQQVLFNGCAKKVRLTGSCSWPS